MLVEQSSADVSPWVQLFQKAHQKITLLERLDEQVLQILTKRQELQDELRDLQSQINEEFNQRIKLAGEPPARLLSAIANANAPANNGAEKQTKHAAEPVTRGTIARNDSVFHEGEKRTAFAFDEELKKAFSVLFLRGVPAAFRSSNSVFGVIALSAGGAILTKVK